MNIKGYDDWKLQTPEEDYDARFGSICKVCGAYSPSVCENDDGCPWQESMDDRADYLRDLRDDR